MSKPTLLEKGFEAFQKCLALNKDRQINGVIIAERRETLKSGDVNAYQVASKIILGFTDKRSMKAKKLREFCQGIEPLEIFVKGNEDKDKDDYLTDGKWIVYCQPLNDGFPKELIELASDPDNFKVRFDGEYEKRSIGFSPKYPILEVVDYSKKGVAVFWNGNKLNDLYGKLTDLGGKYNRNLSHPEDRPGAKSTAFFFDNDRYDALMTFLGMEFEKEDTGEEEDNEEDGE